jgi:hypothetical protein
MTTPASDSNRRSTELRDRRQSRRGGRRAGERRRRWQHLAWLLGGYAIYVAVRGVAGRGRMLLRQRS